MSGYEKISFLIKKSIIITNHPPFLVKDLFFRFILFSYIGKTRSTPQYMWSTIEVNVVHHIYPQHMSLVMLWMYIVEEFIYCGYQLWITTDNIVIVIHNICYVVDNMVCCGRKFEIVENM